MGAANVAALRTVSTSIYLKVSNAEDAKLTATSTTWRRAFERVALLMLSATATTYIDMAGLSESHLETGSQFVAANDLGTVQIRLRR